MSIISPADGGAAPGQTIQAGIFSMTNTSSVEVFVGAVTVSFSIPSLFSSATLSPPATVVARDISGQHDLGGVTTAVTANPPSSSTTFTFNPPFAIGPGGEPFFGLTVKLSPTSRNDTNAFAYAGVTEFSAVRGAGLSLWMAFAILGRAVAALPGSMRRRVWLLEGLMILLAAGAPGCGSDSNGPGPSSTQTVTAVSTGFPVFFDGVVTRPIGASPATVTGLPLKLGTITGQ